MKKIEMSPVILLSILGPFVVSNSALAQGARDKYPSKAIRMIVPLAPGGGTDIIARPLAQRLTEAFDQPVIVDNRPGAGATIGHELVVRAAPDGYTMMVTSSSYVTNAALLRLNYDPIADIAPVAMISEAGFMISVHPSVPAKSTQELIALAKSQPGALNYASSGTGSITHLGAELFNLKAGTKMTHVPYKGTGAALNDLLGGHVQLIVAGMAVMVTMHKSGRLRGIAVTSRTRNAAVPDVPAVSETIPGFEASLWFACLGPKNLPKDIIVLWNTEINRALNTRAMQDQLASEGHVPVGGPSEKLLGALKRDIPTWRKVVDAANVRANQ